MDKSMLEERVGKEKVEKWERVVWDVSDNLVFRDVSCIDADGNVFEHYDELCVFLNIKRYITDGSVFRVNDKFFLSLPGGRGEKLEELGLFLADVALYSHMISRVLTKQYGSTGFRLIKGIKNYIYGLTSSFVNYGTGKIIHYPSANQPKVELNFDFDLEEWLNFCESTDVHFKIRGNDNVISRATEISPSDYTKPAVLRFVKQLSGLTDPRGVFEHKVGGLSDYNFRLLISLPYYGKGDMFLPIYFQGFGVYSHEYSIDTHGAIMKDRLLLLAAPL